MISGRIVTQRPKEHVTGLQALKAVSKVIRRAGYEPEEVANDYGEDLLVQTSRKDRLDASRLWFQVKGTGKIKHHRKNGKLRFQVTFDHAMRWIRSPDLVVIVLWDTVERVGWYAIPSEQVDVFEATNSGTKNVTLRFAEDDGFTEEAVDHLVWRSCLEHHRLLVLSAQNDERDLERAEGVKSQERTLTALDFTAILKITERDRDPDGLRYRVRREVWDEFQSIYKSLPRGENQQQQEQNAIEAADATVVNRWKAIEPKLDLSDALIEEAAKFILDATEELAGIREKMEVREAREAMETREAGWPGEDR
jgi:hypothetical protein